AELPAEMVADDARLLDDLHLSSITVGQVMNQAAQRLGVPVAQTPTNFATATLRELAEALELLTTTAAEVDEVPVVAGAAPWAGGLGMARDGVRVPAGLAAEAGARGRVYARAGHERAEPLRRALERAGVGGGHLVCLPAGCTEEHLALALR